LGRGTGGVRLIVLDSIKGAKTQERRTGSWVLR
jgi:hypothetical protein